MSPTLLSARLKQLVDDGIIRRAGSKGKYLYHLTEAGRELRPVIELLGAWGHRWARSNLDKGDLDAGLLMWDMRRSVNPNAFPDHRIVVHFVYPDAPDGGRNWWLVSEHGDIDLCLNDPGHDVDILVTGSLATMTAVWTCQSSLNDEVRKGNIQVMGHPDLTKNLQDWLSSSPLSRLGTLDQLPELQWDFQ